MKKEIVEEEIYRLGTLYRTSFSDYAKDCYKQYMNLIIIEADRGDQSRLEKMWEWEIE